MDSMESGNLLEKSLHFSTSNSNLNADDEAGNELKRVSIQTQIIIHITIIIIIIIPHLQSSPAPRPKQHFMATQPRISIRCHIREAAKRVLFTRGGEGFAAFTEESIGGGGRWLPGSK